MNNLEILVKNENTTKDDIIKSNTFLDKINIKEELSFFHNNIELDNSFNSVNNKLISGNNFFEMLDDEFSINNNLTKFNNDSKLNFDSCKLYINENYIYIFFTKK